MNRFEGKTLLVTGGTSGIGLASAERLVREGARVIVTGSRRASIEHAKGVLGERAHYVLNDAADAGAAAALVPAVQAVTPQLDGVFFNAGFGRFQPLEGVSAAEFDAQYAVNVRAPLLQAQALAPLLNDGAALLFNTSIARQKGFAAMAIYASTKGALRTLTRVLARELAPGASASTRSARARSRPPSSSAPACRKQAIAELGAQRAGRGAARPLRQAGRGGGGGGVPAVGRRVVRHRRGVRGRRRAYAAHSECSAPRWRSIRRPSAPAPRSRGAAPMPCARPCAPRSARSTRCAVARPP